MRPTDSLGAQDGGSIAHGISRRWFLRSVAAASLTIGSKRGNSQTIAATLNGDHGRIKPPVPVPDVSLLRHDGTKTTLPHLTHGHATAVQLMFTACSTTCPIQAAIFHRVQTLLPAMSTKNIQLLSLSVDPQDVNVSMLSEWRRRYDAGPQWIAAAPALGDSTEIQTFFGQSKGSFADHSTQVNIVDRQGRLVWRTNELPTSEEIAAILSKV